MSFELNVYNISKATYDSVGDSYNVPLNVYNKIQFETTSEDSKGYIYLLLAIENKDLSNSKIPKIKYTMPTNLNQIDATLESSSDTEIISRLDQSIILFQITKRPDLSSFNPIDVKNIPTALHSIDANTKRVYYAKIQLDPLSVFSGRFDIVVEE